MALHRMGSHAKAAVPAAIEDFENSDPFVRRAALLVIGNFVPEEKELIPTVISGLDDPDAGPFKDHPGLNSVSMLAMFRVEKCNSAARAALPKLKKITNAGTASVFYRMVALNALASIAPEDPTTLTTARAWIKPNQDSENVLRGMPLLSRLGRHGKPAVPDVVDKLRRLSEKDKKLERTLKTAALSALQSMGPAAEAALPALRRMLASKDTPMEIRVLDVIRAIETRK